MVAVGNVTSERAPYCAGGRLLLLSETCFQCSIPSNVKNVRLSKVFVAEIVIELWPELAIATRRSSSGMLIAQSNQQVKQQFKIS